jgi:hypothetical protein
MRRENLFNVMLRFMAILQKNLIYQVGSHRGPGKNYLHVFPSGLYLTSQITPARNAQAEICNQASCVSARLARFKTPLRRKSIELPRQYNSPKQGVRRVAA